MIVAKIEMWPGGNANRARDLGVIEIANSGGDHAHGDYDVQLQKSPEYARRPGIWKRGAVQRFPRLRLGPYDLLLRALAAVIGDRNPDAARLALVTLDQVDRAETITQPPVTAAPDEAKIDWSSPVMTGHLIQQLQTYPPETPIHGARFIGWGPDVWSKVRVRPVTISRERVDVDACTINQGDTSIPYSLVIWTSADERKPLASAAPAITGAIADVLAERRRQIEVKGWTPEHDDEHACAEMARAAASYALPESHRPNHGQQLDVWSVPPPFWPWDFEYWKPKDRRFDLVRAAALILAEIERLDRAAHTTEADPQ